MRFYRIRVSTRDADSDDDYEVRDYFLIAKSVKQATSVADKVVAGSGHEMEEYTEGTTERVKISDLPDADFVVMLDIRSGNVRWVIRHRSNVYAFFRRKEGLDAEFSLLQMGINMLVWEDEHENTVRPAEIDYGLSQEQQHYIQQQLAMFHMKEKLSEVLGIDREKPRFVRPEPSMN